MPATRCSEGYSAGTWGADPLDRPPVKIDPPTTPKWYPMTLTARRSHRRKPREVHRNLPQTQTLSGTADAHPHARKHGGAHRFLNNTIRDIDSRRKSLQRATKSGDILYVTNVLTPGDNCSNRGRQFEIDGAQQGTAADGFPLSPQAASDMLNDPAAAPTRSLPDQSTSGWCSRQNRIH